MVGIICTEIQIDYFFDNSPTLRELLCLSTERNLQGNYQRFNVIVFY